jgi:hypothetical protein
MGVVKLKDPDEIIDWTHDWNDGWLSASETISTSVWTITPSGSLAQTSESETTNTATIFLNSGNVGTLYRVTNRITTNQSRTAERTIVIRVEER